MPEPTAPAPSDAAPPQDPTPSLEPSDELGESGEKALEAWKTRAREAEKLAKRLKPLEAELQQIRDKDKSETQRANDEASQAKADAAQARTDFLRLKVGMAKGLPASLAERLKGDNEEEMTADADALLAALKPKGNGAGSFDAGTKQTAPPASPDMNAHLRRMAGRA